jgi:hypothetical protein
MPYFAVMSQQQEGKSIVNTAIVAESLEDANQIINHGNLGSFCIEYDPNSPDAPGIGFIWDGEKFTDRFAVIENSESGE